MTDNRRARVLVIDDDAMIRRVMMRVLEHAGHTAVGVASVREGMRAIHNGGFDVVVTDVYMPDEDGLDALRQLREAKPHMPVIVMSGQLVDSFGTTLRSVLVSLGAYAVLPKGTDGKEVVSVVAEIARSLA